LRVSKSEIGLTHFEGRSYVGLMRHLILCLTALGFVALHTERLRGEKPGSDDGASVPGAERPLRGVAAAATGNGSDPAHGRAQPVSPSTYAGRAGVEEEAEAKTSMLPRAVILTAREARRQMCSAPAPPQALRWSGSRRGGQGAPATRPAPGPAGP